jgi:hypothetical protein
MRFLTPRIHGILDYVAAIVLIAAPFLLGFVNANLPALCISLVLGLGLLGYSLITDYAYSLFGAVSFRIHLVFDVVLGLGLVAVPFIFGFAGAVKTYYLAMGIGFLMVVALTGSRASGKRSANARRPRLRFLTPRIHGVLDYAAVIVLVAAPFLLGLAATNRLALGISLVLGVALLGYSLITDYAYSLSGTLSFKIHLVFDALSGLGAIAAPFIFGFGGVAKIYYIVMGVGVLLVVALTDPRADSVESPGAVLKTMDF